MLFLVAATLCLYSQTPPLPTLAEIRKSMAEDMRKLRNYSDEWEITSPSGEGEVEKLEFKRFVDGPRAKSEVMINGKVLLESGYDGTNAWMVSHPAKVYADEKSENRAFAIGELGPPKDAETGQFVFTFSGPYDFNIWAKPDLEVTSVETVKLNGVDKRKVTTLAKRETGQIQVEMWFDTDRWRMVRARAYGGKSSEKPTEVVMTMLKSKTDEKYDASSFVLEQSKVAGYEKKSFKELEGGGGPATALDH